MCSGMCSVMSYTSGAISIPYTLSELLHTAIYITIDLLTVKFVRSPVIPVIAWKIDMGIAQLPVLYALLFCYSCLFCKSSISWARERGGRRTELRRSLRKGYCTVQTVSGLQQSNFRRLGLRRKHITPTDKSRPRLLGNGTPTCKSWGGSPPELGGRQLIMLRVST